MRASTHHGRGGHADEFDVWADSGLAGEAGCKASPAEDQEFRRLIDTATWQQTAQVLKPRS